MTVTKRIAILVARNNFVYRGVGSYVKSIIDWALKSDYYVDIISDDKVRDNGLFDQYKDKVNWFTPKVTINDSTYKELSAFSKPFDTALSMNFRNSLVGAMKKHTYDLIITNVGEALDAVTGLGVHKYCTVMHPTHHESEACLPIKHDIFSPGVSERYTALCSLPDVILACQSNWVRQNVVAVHKHKNAEALEVPCLVPELSLLKFPDVTDRWGVGFVGPWEPRKNPEAFIDALKAAGLPGVAIVPSESSAKKFAAKFKEAGIEHKIHIGISGEEKVRVFQSLAAAYHPAVSETFGLGALETAHCCPTVLSSKYAWSDAHVEYCTIVDEKDAASKLKALYGQPVSDDTKKVLIERQKRAERLLDNLTKRPGGKKTTNNFYTELDKTGLVKHSEFTVKMASFCTDEIYKMLRLPAIDTVEVLHTKDETYYRVKGTSNMPSEDSSPSSLFDFG
jgi:glycosyltransferase involved in cell wall biosynthesis